jgi:ABC-type nitrate/sulfonate/bicarbonate transport system substrate-binding protein
VVAARLGYVERLRDRIWGKSPRLSAGDFPAGVSAPVDAVAALPTRPTVVGVVPEGGTAPLLWAGAQGFFSKAYAMEVRTQAFASEAALRSALLKGGDAGGVDFAALSVSSLAFNWRRLRDASPRTLGLVERSRGQVELVAAKAHDVAALKGQRLACEPGSAGHYFALWALSRAGLAVRELTWVDVASQDEALQALQQGRADAAVADTGELEPLVKDKGWTVLADSADAPHLLATVLVVRGDFDARYPDAVKRVLRGTLEANQTAGKDPSDVARALGDVAPQLGDPNEALKRSVLASVKDNLAYFSLSGDSPVTYSEKFTSAAQLAVKLGLLNNPPQADDTTDLGPLRYISTRTGL